MRSAGVVLGLALFVALSWGVRDYVIDDTFIHLQYAKNVRDGQGLVFNPGEPVAGTTSPLWSFALGVIGEGGFDLLRLARALGMASALFAFLCVAAAATRLGLRDAHVAAACLAWGANAWMARWGVSGMETAAAVLLVVAGWLVAHGGGTHAAGPGRRFAAGLIWGLAALTRPEAALLVGPYVAFSFLWPRGFDEPVPLGERLAHAGAAAAGAALVVAPYAVYALGAYGALLPGTLAAKAAGGMRLEVAQQRVVQIVMLTGAVCAVETAALVLSAPRLGRLVRHGDAAVHAASFAFLVLVPLGYVVRGVPVISRYLLPLYPLLVLYGWWGLDRFRRDRDTLLRRTVVAAALVAALGANLYVYASRVVPHTRDFVEGMERTLIPWGLWLGAHAPSAAVVATPDIGAIGFYGDRRVLDLGGLVTPAIVPLMEAMPYDDLVRSFAFARVARPDYLVDRGAGSARLLRESPFAPALTPLFTARTRSLGIAKPEPVDYTLYRVDWAVFDSLAATGVRAGR